MALDGSVTVDGTPSAASFQIVHVHGGDQPLKTCKRCGIAKPIDQFPIQHGCRTNPCKACSYLARKKERNEKRAKFLFDHPRCCICDRPLRIRGRFTCSRKCAYTRWNWMR